MILFQLFKNLVSWSSIMRNIHSRKASSVHSLCRYVQYKSEYSIDYKLYRVANNTNTYGDHNVE